MEQWETIAGYESYQVSSFGRIKSLKHGKEKILTQNANKKGYLRIGLCKDGRRKHFQVHRLVAEAFIPNPENKPEVNHIDGVKTNNHVSNLEWITSKENTYHAFRAGLRTNVQGEEAPRAKLTNEQVRHIRENPEKFNTVELAEKFGVSQSRVSDIQLGKKYRTAGGKIRERLHEGFQHLPDEQRNQIRAEYQFGVEGYSTTALAKKYGVNQKTIWRIIHEK